MRKRTKLFAALVSLAFLVGVVSPAHAYQAWTPDNDLVYFYHHVDYEYDHDLQLGQWPDFNQNGTYANYGSITAPMTVAGDGVSHTIGTYYGDFEFDDDGAAGYAVGYADPFSGSSKSSGFTLNAAADDAIGLTAQFVFSAQETTSDNNDQSGNVVQVGRSGSGANDDSCDGPDDKCYGQMKIQLTDPDANGGNVYPQCVVRGGTTSEILKITSSTEPLEVGDYYTINCVKYPDGGSNTAVELTVWNLTDYAATYPTPTGYFYQLSQNSTSPIGPVRTKLFYSVGNKWQNPDQDDQFYGVLYRTHLCVDTDGSVEELEETCLTDGGITYGYPGLLED